VVIEQLKSELRSSREIICGLETERDASVMGEEIKVLRQINETQEEKIINLTNELHAKGLKVEKLKAELEKPLILPTGQDDGVEDGEWTDIGSAITLREELERQKEKNTKLKAKFAAYKTKVAAYRAKKANERAVCSNKPCFSKPVRKPKKKTRWL
jgi:peptidoglycan hydrolase CwlO-like protein